MNRVTHDAEQSSDEGQVFWLEINDHIASEDAQYMAELRAWMALGFDDIDEFEKLTSYKRNRWNAIRQQAMLLEAVKMAYRTNEVKWLVKNDVDFEIHPFDWHPAHTSCAPKICIDDNSAAMLFKLTWCGTRPLIDGGE